MKKEIAIIIDGPNLINRILDLGINKRYIIGQFSLASLRDCLNWQLEELGYEYSCNTIEFVCSQKVFGSGNNKFTQDERNSLINRLKKEKGVCIEEISLPGTAEKGVDMTVAQRLQDFAKEDEISVLISADRDYVPVLNRLRKERKKVITISFNDDFPIEIQNESYETINLRNEYRGFFIYSYPEYNVTAITLDEFKDMFANADDRKNNQLRVYQSGDVFISHEYVGAENLSCLQFRWETYDAYNGYVGPIAASDDEYMKEEYEALKKDWNTGRKGYIDYRI
jgi:uncharacterized LabA/DUF88 family protein